MEAEKRIRREIANSNERRRMQSINNGFQSLRSLLPHHEGEKLSKVSYIISRENSHKKHIIHIVFSKKKNYNNTRAFVVSFVCMRFKIMTLWCMHYYLFYVAHGHEFGNDGKPLRSSYVLSRVYRVSVQKTILKIMLFGDPAWGARAGANSGANSFMVVSTA